MSFTTKYEMTEQGIMRTDAKGNTTQLTNFDAQINKETVRTDGQTNTTTVEVTGTLDGETLPPVEVKATEFAVMNWVPKHWGLTPIIYPVPNAERDIATAIQSTSKPNRETIYLHTGWTTINKTKRVYLTSTGAITPQGLNPGIKIELPNDLRKYELPNPTNVARSTRASLALLSLLKQMYAWPLFLATYRPPLGNTDFGIHLAGKTGTFKSEAASLYQSHYGEKMTARHLPGSWSSTANALEALAYAAKDALFTIDDFVPQGTAAVQKQLNQKADTIFRGQGNQAGRARMTDTTKLNQTYYPRGLVLSTGEDIPEGHSVRGRMIIIDITPGDIEPENLTIAQKNRSHYQNAMAGWIQSLAVAPQQEAFTQIVDNERNQYQEHGHARTPTILAQLHATGVMFLQYAAIIEAITQKEKTTLTGIMQDALHAIGEQQQQYLEEENVTTAFTTVIRELFATRTCHAKTPEGGIPINATECGYDATGGEGQIQTYQRKGPCIAWIEWHTQTCYISADHITYIQSKAKNRLPGTRNTIIKRLNDAGMLVRRDEARQRLTVRKRLDGTTRNVIALSLASIFGEPDK